MKKNLTHEHNSLQKMIKLYCRSHHHSAGDQLCPDYQSLADYAHLRIDRCPFKVNKPTCAKCPIHCYKPDRREEIRQEIRFSGPRMLLHHPILAIRHLLNGLREPPAS